LPAFAYVRYQFAMSVLIFLLQFVFSQALLYTKFIKHRSKKEEKTLTPKSTTKVSLFLSSISSISFFF